MKEKHFNMLVATGTIIIMVMITNMKQDYESRIDALDTTVQYYRSLYYEELQRVDLPPPEMRIPNA